MQLGDETPEVVAESAHFGRRQRVEGAHEQGRRRFRTTRDEATPCGSGGDLDTSAIRLTSLALDESDAFQAIDDVGDR